MIKLLYTNSTVPTVLNPLPLNNLTLPTVPFPTKLVIDLSKLKTYLAYFWVSGFSNSTTVIVASPGSDPKTIV